MIAFYQSVMVTRFAVAVRHPRPLASRLWPRLDRGGHCGLEVGSDSGEDRRNDYADDVGVAEYRSALNSTACHPDVAAARLTASFETGVGDAPSAGGGEFIFPAPDHERFVPQSSRFEVGDQSGRGLLGAEVPSRSETNRKLNRRGNRPVESLPNRCPIVRVFFGNGPYFTCQPSEDGKIAGKSNFLCDL